MTTAAIITRGTSLIRHAGPFKVHSLANGHLRVECAWPEERVTLESGDRLGPGVFSRARLAAQVEALLNRERGR